GAVQFDWFFPIFNSGFYGYLQYFSGYGESLADYNRHIDKIGLGVAFKQ
ncbi:MAG: phospholipase A, partial [Campylobacter sp.]|nr:phospholipase A [Campylobacter sp.]